MLKDFSVSAVLAGFVAALVGFTSSVAVIFQATRSLGATPEQTASWLWGLGMGMAVASVALSLKYRIPVLIAWSTPGAAVIAGAAADGNLSLPQATGAFLMCAALLTVAGFSGGFERVMKRLPMPLASALLAGVLSKFALETCAAVPGNPVLILSMAAAYGLGQRFWPRAKIPGILLVGVTVAALQGKFHAGQVPLGITWPVWVLPEFSWAVLVGVALPLFVVTMASQNLPGVAVFRVHGYQPPVSQLIGWAGVANLAMAACGGFTLNLAAITAAFCMGPDAHPDAGKRYVSAMAAGLFYGLIGLFGATIVALLAAFPNELILALAGLALLGTIASGLAAATADERYREAAVISYFVVLSGVSVAGIGSAFWGIVVGGLVVLLGKLAGRTA
jgi:benzoate membrane transport protein